MGRRGHEPGYVSPWQCIIARIHVSSSPISTFLSFLSISSLVPPPLFLSSCRHWDWFLESVHQGEIIDQPNGYGWEGARELDKTLAKYNADSYGWYATEFFWAVICGKATGYD